jgi:hypothetical protein
MKNNGFPSFSFALLTHRFGARLSAALPEAGSIR